MTYRVSGRLGEPGRPTKLDRPHAQQSRWCPFHGRHRMASRPVAAATIATKCLALAAAGTIAAACLAQQPAPTAVEVAPAIRLNTLGYLPGASKKAVVTVPSERFVVVRVGDDEQLFEGTVTGPVLNEDTEEELYTADFSALAEPGEYQLDVAGAGRSAPFRIARDIYDRPFRTVTRAMYLWRCGTEVAAESDGDLFQHAACHLGDGRLDLVGNVGEHRDATGGWHDAGDYNKYVANVGVTAGCMFRAWAEFQPRIERALKGSGVLPSTLVLSPTPNSESAVRTANANDSRPRAGGPLPDFLAELKWELDWLLKMQADDGSVYHKLSAANYCGYMMPEEELDPRYFGEWGSAATADFVAIMATAARHFRPYDPDYAERCLAAARRSYEFLQTNPNDHRPRQEGFSTGGYTSPDWDDRLWAAAELWETTGDAAVLTDFEARAQSARPVSRRRPRQSTDGPDSARLSRFQWQVAADWDWSNVANLGLITYLTSKRPGRNAELVSQIEGSLLETANRIVETRSAHGYGRPLGTRYYWGCNGTVARQSLVLHAANQRAPNPEYRETALDALNYLFGRNCHGRSYVTGIGQRPPLHPHDRRAAADDVDAPWPGYLVGGPERNARDWNDEQDDYRTNEIAVNWNGALIYALAVVLDDSE